MKQISSLPNSLTGDRPTGSLHIGHYVGSIQKRLDIQNTHNSFIMIADAQAYTDHIKNREKVQKSVLQLMEDYLSVGLCPDKNIFFLQSAVPEIQELSFYLSNLVTVSRIERIPTIKKEIFQKFGEGEKSGQIPRNIPFGFLNYPVSQSADILAFNTDIVPVGLDQLPIIELTNEIVHSFNSLVNQNIFKSCTPICDREKGTLEGIDGKHKMSKTLGNTINLNATNKEIAGQVKKMFTDPNHLRIEDPGEIQGNMVFTYLDYFYQDKEALEDLKSRYRKGGVGDGYTKKLLTDTLIEFFEPIQNKRQNINKEELVEILKRDTYLARETAQRTVDKVKQALGLTLF